jgi:hypothetical protein
MIVDHQGRRVSLILRLVPETPREVAELRKFCRLTDAFSFYIDEEFRENSAHIAPVFAERAFSVVQRPELEEVAG